MVPLVSMAISKLRWCSASISAAIELQQRLAAGADDEALLRRRHAATGCDGVGQGVGGGELAAAVAVGADEVGVAEVADRGRAVLLAAAPQVAAGEAAEHRGAAGVGALALQCVEDFLDRVGHGGSASDTARGRGARLGEALQAQQAGVALAAGRRRVAEGRSK